MIVAVIIEDERVIREGLEKHVPWKELGIDHVYSAQQAEGVFDICSKVKPDIIVSDIRMPGMNGIQVCRKLREVYKDCQIIFVTGFSDKEYLKAAIELHAVSYVEKPVNVQELSEAVKNAVTQIRKARAHKKAILYSAFTNSDKIEYVWTRDLYFQAGVLYYKNRTDKMENNIYFSSLMDKIAEENGLHISMEQVNDNTEGFLFSSQNSMKCLMEEILKYVEKQIREAEFACFFGFGQEVYGREKIKESYESALDAKSDLSYKGWNHISIYSETSGHFVDKEREKEWIDCFTSAVTCKNLKKAIEISSQITETLKQNHVVINSDVRYLYFLMENIVNRYLANKKDVTEQEEQYINLAETLDELQGYIVGLIQSMGNMGDETKNSYLVHIVTDYILNHYHEKDLSIKILADQVYLTPTYLSNLYKKYMGITIGQYLVDVRIEHAVELLKDPRWKLYQIADMVGYEDANYFTKIFKKKIGITPSEYREKTWQ